MMLHSGSVITTIAVGGRCLLKGQHIFGSLQYYTFIAMYPGHMGNLGMRLYT